MTTQAEIIETREKRVHFDGHPNLTGAIVRGDLYSDQVTVKWDDGRLSKHWTSAVHLVHGSPTWIGADAHYPDGSIVAADGEITRP